MAKSYVKVDGKRILSDYRKEQMREYQKANYQAILDYQNEYKQRKLKENPLLQKERNVKSAIRYGFKKNGWDVGSRLYLIIGLTFEDYKKHIESQWEEGMTWDNYGIRQGQWVIDHIIPISSAQDEIELLKLFHYTNARPMWQDDNVRKSNKIE